jgi:hypothetical protein
LEAVSTCSKEVHILYQKPELRRLHKNVWKRVEDSKQPFTPSILIWHGPPSVENIEDIEYDELLEDHGFTLIVFTTGGLILQISLLFMMRTISTPMASREPEEATPAT